MQVDFTCECGQWMRADVGAEPATAQCPACGSLLTVSLPAALGRAPQPRRKPTSGKAVAALVFGLCGLLPGLGVLSAPIGIGLGIAVLGKKLEGKGFGIAGIATGGVGLVFQGIVTLWVIMIVSLFRQMSGMMTAVGPTTAPALATTMPTTDQEIGAALAMEPIRPRSRRAAEAELTRAKTLHAARAAKPPNAYRALEHYARYLAFREGGGFEYARDAETCRALRQELVRRVRDKLDRARQFERQAQWQKAEGVYAELMKLVPDSDNAIHAGAATKKSVCRAMRGMPNGSVVIEKNDE